MEEERHSKPSGKWWVNEYIKQSYYCNFRPTRHKYTDYFYHKLPFCMEEVEVGDIITTFKTANVFRFKKEYRED